MNRGCISPEKIEDAVLKILYPVEYHHFKLRGSWFLFDVNALTVISSCDLDRTILEMSVDGLNAGQLAEKVVRTGMPRQMVEDRVDNLTENWFLIPSGDTPERAKAGETPDFATFMINVSQHCNLTCSYCYVNMGHFDYKETPISKMQDETSRQIVERIYDQFSGFKTYHYHFYGGEPLLNFDAVKLIVHSAEEKAHETDTRSEYHITTNGTLLTQEIADFMDEYCFTVYFSIDGDGATHDEQRKYVNGKGSFSDVERNLAYLCTKPNVHLIGSSVIRNGLSMSNAIDMLEKQGAHQCKAERARLGEDDNLSLKGEGHAEYIRDIEGLTNHYIEYLSSGRKPMDYRLSSKILQVFMKTRRDSFCPAGSRMFGISAEGEIYPCALHVGRPQSRLGDIQNGINPQKQQLFMNKFSVENQEDCRSCWTRHLCGGGCSAMVDRFGNEDCQSLKSESESAIAIYKHFADRDPIQILGLVSPRFVKWINEELEDIEDSCIEDI